MGDQRLPAGWWWRGLPGSRRVPAGSTAPKRPLRWALPPLPGASRRAPPPTPPSPLASSCGGRSDPSKGTARRPSRGVRGNSPSGRGSAPGRARGSGRRGPTGCSRGRAARRSGARRRARRRRRCRRVGRRRRADLLGRQVAAVPRSCPSGSAGSAAVVSLAMPKSMILTVPSSSTRMLPGLTSRWMTPWEWAYSRPRATCRR